MSEDAPRAPWAPDRELEPGDLERLVAAHAPDLRDRTMAALGEGWDFWTFDAGGEVLRVAKRDAVAALVAREVALLRMLAPRMPIPIPRAREAGPGAMRYPRLPGVPLGPRVVTASEARRVALALGGFLTELHAFPREQALAAGIPDTGWERVGPRARRSLARLRSVASRLPRDVVAAAERALGEAQPPEGAGPTPLTHADLRAEHVLVDEASLEPVGIIDWGDAQLGDPAVDFVGTWELGGDVALSAALGRYGHPWTDAFARRARLFGACHAIFDVWYSIERQLPAYYEAAVASLARLA